uniref:Protein kinase domain-containing protein n=1 Tax=Globodera rostochiensis TaxID=31243 RepID=A0A914HG33_GLORO
MELVKERLQKLKGHATERSKFLSGSVDLDKAPSTSTKTIKDFDGLKDSNLADLEQSKNAFARCCLCPLCFLSSTTAKQSRAIRKEKAPHDRGRNNSVQLPIPNRSMSGHALIVNGKGYSVLSTLGKGGSSVVYQAFSECHKRCVAIKCVDLSSADATLQDSPNVIRVFDFEKRKNKMFVVMECGDIDLATFMHKRSKEIDAKFVKYHWQEMLKCVKVIHDKNIVHSDLKPANFLFVGASLKLIDFGIASNIPSNKTSVMKEIQVGTLSYMSPEAIIGSYIDNNGVTIYKVPLKSDVWSLGCILYAMVYGRTPFQHLTNQMAKITAISSERHTIEFPKLHDHFLLDVLKKCLVREFRNRATIDELLAHQYMKDSLLATPSPRVPLPGKRFPLASIINGTEVEQKKGSLMRGKIN